MYCILELHCLNVKSRHWKIGSIIEEKIFRSQEKNQWKKQIVKFQKKTVKFMKIWRQVLSKAKNKKILHMGWDAKHLKMEDHRAFKIWRILMDGYLFQWTCRQILALEIHFITLSQEFQIFIHKKKT